MINTTSKFTDAVMNIGYLFQSNKPPLETKTPPQNQIKKIQQAKTTHYIIICIHVYKYEQSTIIYRMTKDCFQKPFPRR